MRAHTLAHPVTASPPPAPWPRRRRCTARPRRACRPRLAQRAEQRDDDARAAAPIGWPSAQAPPCTLTISCGSLSSVIAAIVHRGEGLVDLPQVDVARRPSRPCSAAFCDGADRRGGEPLGRLRVHRVARRCAPAACSPALRAVRLAHQHQRGGAVGDADDVGGGDGAVLLERGLQARDLVELGLERAARRT